MIRGHVITRRHRYFRLIWTFDSSLGIPRLKESNLNIFKKTLRNFVLFCCCLLFAMIHHIFFFFILLAVCFRYEMSAAWLTWWNDALFFCFFFTKSLTRAISRPSCDSWTFKTPVEVTIAFPLKLIVLIALKLIGLTRCRRLARRVRIWWNFRRYASALRKNFNLGRHTRTRDTQKMNWKECEKVGGMWKCQRTSTGQQAEWSNGVRGHTWRSSRSSMESRFSCLFFFLFLFVFIQCATTWNTHTNERAGKSRPAGKSSAAAARCPRRRRWGISLVPAKTNARHTKIFKDAVLFGSSFFFFFFFLRLEWGFTSSRLKA